MGHVKLTKGIPKGLLEPIRRNTSTNILSSKNDETLNVVTRNIWEKE